MGNLVYITENDALQVIKDEMASPRNKGLKGTEGFAEHLIDTGRIAYDIALQILSKHSSLKPFINPDALRVEGYMQDFGKIHSGPKYHEIATADVILSRGKEMGLVAGGTQSERTRALKEIALIVPPDYALFEALGGNDFPNNPAYPEVIGDFIERVSRLRRDLSDRGEPLTMEEFGLPFSLNQQIGLYADLTNVNGQRVSVGGRVAEIEQRYSQVGGKFYDPTYAELTRKIRPRVLVVGKTIENLLV